MYRRISSLRVSVQLLSQARETASKPSPGLYQVICTSVPCLSPASQADRFRSTVALPHQVDLGSLFPSLTVTLLYVQSGLLSSQADCSFLQGLRQLGSEAHHDAELLEAFGLLPSSDPASPALAAPSSPRQAPTLAQSELHAANQVALPCPGQGPDHRSASVDERQH